MGRLDFHIEVYSEVEHLEENLVAEAETRLYELAEGYHDMIGASIAVEELTQEQTPHHYQARVVAYVKPENVVAVEKGDSLDLALKGALDALERQIRKLRDKKGKPWQRPTGTGGTLTPE